MKFWSVLAILTGVFLAIIIIDKVENPGGYELDPDDPNDLRDRYDPDELVKSRPARQEAN